MTEIKSKKRGLRGPPVRAQMLLLNVLRGPQWGQWEPGGWALLGAPAGRGRVSCVHPEPPGS